MLFKLIKPMNTQFMVIFRLSSLARWVALSFCLILLPIPSLRADDKAVRDAFKTQYEPHAKDLWEYYSNFAAKIVSTQFFPKGKDDIETVEVTCSGRFFLLKARNERRVGATFVEGMNSRYGLTLEQKGGTDFVVREVNLLQPGERGGPCFLTAPAASPLFGKQPYLELTRDDTIRFVSFEDSPWQGKSAKKLQIRYDRPPQKNIRKPVAVDVSYFFSPQEGWICRGMRFQAVGQPQPDREDVFFYEQRANSRFPPLKRLETWMRNSKGTRLTSTTDINEFEHHKPFPETDFTLTAFGLPEPYGVVWTKPTPWYLWFIGLAVVFLALGWVFRRRVRRRAAMVALHPRPGS